MDGGDENSVIGNAAARDAERLGRIAAALPFGRQAAAPACDVTSFADLMRTWVVAHHGLPGSRDEQVERTRLLLHVMASAATLGEAAALLARFRRLVWNDRGLYVEPRSGGATLVLDQPARTGAAGALSELWSLAFLLAEFEFLAGGRIGGVTGSVRARHDQRCSPALLLFPHPLTWEADRLVLQLSASAMRRPVVVTGSRVAEFLAELMPRAVGSRTATPATAPVVAAMLRMDLLSDAAAGVTMTGVAARLGLSAATVRRRLAAEGTSFRLLRADMLDDLATVWLQDGARVEAIAERLGYADAFAFRRAFHRRHGCAPTVYRQTANASRAALDAAVE